MSREPLISVVTPTRDRAALLRFTIDSVRAQTFDDYEHIVIDGGSRDGTVEMLASVESTYPLRWISEPDGGMYDAINKGLALARGRILAYLNSDDLYFPWTLEVVAREFLRRPSVDFVYGDALSVDEESGVRRVYWQFPFHADTIRRTGFLAQPTVFWRRTVTDAIGRFDESLRYVADCEYWMRASDRFQFRKLHEVLAVERDHGGTLRATEPAVWSELARVRSRYVSLVGPTHFLLHRRNVARLRVLERLYSVAILCQSRVPRSLRLAPWARFVSAEEQAFDVVATLRSLLPGQWRRRGEIMKPDRRWLEPRLDQHSSTRPSDFGKHQVDR